MRIFIMFFGNIIFNASANVLIKLGMKNVENVELNSLNSMIKNLLLNPPLIIGCVCYALSLIFYMLVLQKVNLSIAYPIVVSCSVIIVSVISRFMFQEIISWNHLAGYAAILVGIYFIMK